MLNLIQLQGSYLETWRHLSGIFESKSFVEFGTFVSTVKLRVLEESPICQMTEHPTIVITQKTQVNSELLLLCTGQKR